MHNEHWVFGEPNERKNGGVMVPWKQALRAAADANPGQWVMTTEPRYNLGSTAANFKKAGYESVIRSTGTQSADGKTLYHLYLRRPEEK